MHVRPCTITLVQYSTKVNKSTVQCSTNPSLVRVCEKFLNRPILPLVGGNGSNFCGIASANLELTGHQNNLIPGNTGLSLVIDF